MKIETEKKGINKGEFFCESEKNIKKLLDSLHLDDNYYANIYFGHGSNEVLKKKIVFHFWYSSRKYGDIEENKGKHQMHFQLYPIKQKDFTIEIKTEFAKRVLPNISQEIVSCVKRNDIIDFVSGILVSIESGKLKIEYEKK